MVRALKENPTLTPFDAVRAFSHPVSGKLAIPERFCADNGFDKRAPYRLAQSPLFDWRGNGRKIHPFNA